MENFYGSFNIRKTDRDNRRINKKLYQTEGKAEIIDGEIVEIMATGDEPDSAAFNIAVSLKDYQRKTGSGGAYSDHIGFVVNLSNRKSFSPDASFHTGNRTGMKFLEGAPIFLPPERRSSGTLIC